MSLLCSCGTFQRMMSAWDLGWKHQEGPLQLVWAETQEDLGQGA